MDLQRWRQLLGVLDQVDELRELRQHVTSCSECVWTLPEVSYCPEAQRLAFEAVGPAWSATLKGLEAPE